MFSTLFPFVFQFLLLTTYHLFLHFRVIQKKLEAKENVGIFFTLVILTQLITSAMLQREVGDVMLFAGAGWHLRHQIDFYFIDANHTQYPFFPFLIFLHAGLNWLQELLPFFTFSFYLKIVLMAAVVSISFLIKKVVSGTEHHKAVIHLQFLTNPLVTLAVFFHGQVDVFLLAFFVWSVFVLEKTEGVKHTILGVGLYTASVAAKTWSIIFLPWLVYTQKSWVSKLFIVISLVVGLLGCTFVYTRLVEGSSVRTVLPAVLRPGGPVGEWGLSLLVRPWISYVQKYNLFIFGVGMAITYALLFWKKVKGWLAYVFLLLGVYIFIPNFGIQYLFWIVPFLYLSKQLSSKEFIIFSLGSTLYAFASYLIIAAGELIIPISLVRLLGFCLWVFCINWALNIVKAVRQ